MKKLFYKFKIILKEIVMKNTKKLTLHEKKLVHFKLFKIWKDYSILIVIFMMLLINII